jgi:hypothetical protein
MVEDIADATTGELDSVQNALRNEQATLRLLATELAIGAYALDFEESPQSLAQLVPQYLSRLALDPFDPGGGHLRYKRAGDGPYQLYSVGSNGVDDGGQPPSTYRGRFHSDDQVLNAYFSNNAFLPKLRPRRASVRFTRPVDCSIHFVQSHTLDTGVIPQKIHRHFYLPTPNRDGPIHWFSANLLLSRARKALLRLSNIVRRRRATGNDVRTVRSMIRGVGSGPSSCAV